MSDVGWLDYASDGETAGQVGAGNNIEAVQIELTGDAAEKYDVWYRVHSDKAGWLGWASNGEVAGTTGLRYGMQALEVRIQEKGGEAPGSTEGANINRIISHYKVHVSKQGWQDAVIDGATSGTTGQKLSVEGPAGYGYRHGWSRDSVSGTRQRHWVAGSGDGWSYSRNDRPGEGH